MGVAIAFNWLVHRLIMIHTIKMAETKEELTTFCFNILLQAGALADMQIDGWSLNHVRSSQFILWLLNICMRYYNYYNDRSKQNFDLKNPPGLAGAYGGLAHYHWEGYSLMGTN